jgi:hypothetical protein
MIIAIVKPDSTLVVHGILTALPEGVRVARIDTEAGTALLEYEADATEPVEVRDFAAEAAAAEAARAADEPEPQKQLYKTVLAPKGVKKTNDLTQFQAIIDALQGAHV